MITYTDIQECSRTIFIGTAKMAQQRKALASKPDSLGSILGAHTMEEEKTDSLKLPFDLYTCAVAHSLHRSR